MRVDMLLGTHSDVAWAQSAQLGLNSGCSPAALRCHDWSICKVIIQAGLHSSVSTGLEFLSRNCVPGGFFALPYLSLPSEIDRQNQHVH